MSERELPFSLSDASFDVLSFFVFSLSLESSELTWLVFVLILQLLQQSQRDEGEGQSGTGRDYWEEGREG